MFKIYVQIGGGAYFCHRCGSKGSWYDFKMKLGGYDVVDTLGKSSFPNNQKNANGNSSNGSGSTYARQNYQNRNQNGKSNNGHNRDSNASNNQGNNHKNSNDQPLPMPSPRLQAAYITNLLDSPPQTASSSSDALEYLTETRGLTKQTLRKYGVGLGSYNFPSNEPGKSHKYVRADCITFPWIMRSGEVEEQEVLRGGSYHWEKTSQSESESKEHDKDSSVEEGAEGEGETSPLGPFITRRIKARAVHNKAWQRLDPPGGGWGLFGWHTVPADATEIIITEGEYDAMAVHQATGRPAVSLPNGCRSLPVEVLPILERFETIYLWMDNDGPGREGAEQFAKKIGVNRCMIVQPDSSVEGKTAPKDANEALLEGMDLEEIIRGGGVLPHERILTFSELRKEVLHEMLNPERYAGVPIPSLPGFTDIIKGFRRGEMTVLTGSTGSGEYV
jgi:twinkle protein